MITSDGRADVETCILTGLAVAVATVARQQQAVVPANGAAARAL
jgi:hypothetical protein